MNVTGANRMNGSPASASGASSPAVNGRATRPWGGLLPGCATGAGYCGRLPGRLAERRTLLTPARNRLVQQGVDRRPRRCHEKDLVGEQPLRHANQPLVDPEERAGGPVVAERLGKRREDAPFAVIEVPEQRLQPHDPEHHVARGHDERRAAIGAPRRGTEAVEEDL